ncbi:hypothetical protein DNTS_025777 [Danionella cerebrum]|uniref:Ig-like domain-containing protein n=1 Tax=Danionella cerebrum TaxID=2873325 RepID=A0A553N4K4_9TELE|nr:hypothetical protein DNTS_025777 [Danionella translucida]
MKVLIFFIYMLFDYSEISEAPTFMTTYTAIRGDRPTEIPELSAVASLDGQPIAYYDSKTKRLVLNRVWEKLFATLQHDVINKDVQEVYENNMLDLLEHAEFSYVSSCNGKDFISLDVRKGEYVTSVPEAKATVDRWNNNKKQLEILKHYHEYACYYWLWKYADNVKQKERLTVSLLQKNPDAAVDCHVTDGTLQRTVTLKVPQADWKNGNYRCVVNTFQEILTEVKVKSNSKLIFHIQPPFNQLFNYSRKYTRPDKSRSFETTEKPLITAAALRSRGITRKKWKNSQNSQKRGKVRAVRQQTVKLQLLLFTTQTASGVRDSCQFQN